jgi:hypothetical protein
MLPAIINHLLTESNQTGDERLYAGNTTIVG